MLNSSVYEALLSGADHIKKNPDSFKFWESVIPRGDDGIGCVIGWTGYYLGHRDGRSIMSTYEALGISSDMDLYDRMDQTRSIIDKILFRDWKDDACVAARAMRKYARKYHAPEVA